MKPTDCTQCYHYGQSCVSGKVGCALWGKYDVVPAKCHEFVQIRKEGRK
jgi:hypothetical protein